MVESDMPSVTNDINIDITAAVYGEWYGDSGHVKCTRNTVVTVLI